MTSSERDDLLSRVDERVSEMLNKVDDIHSRVGELEAWRNRLKGAWAALVFVGGAVGILIGMLIKSL